MDLARWAGDAEEARRQIALATSLLGSEAEEANYLAMCHDLLSRVTDDLDEARGAQRGGLRGGGRDGHCRC